MKAGLPPLLPANGPTAPTVRSCENEPAGVHDHPSNDHDSVQSAPARVTRRYTSLPGGAGTAVLSTVVDEPPTVLAA